MVSFDSRDVAPKKKLQVEFSQSFRLMKTTWRFFAPYFLFDSTKIDIYDPPVDSQ